MNLNIKLEGEEEQTIQYVNRFEINIPPTAFNLNIINSGLNNQGYILNPVNSVGQNFLAYQSPMALQSYFTLPESEGNILHSLPVGVPVPVGLPVQTGFLQNNFVNTGIIIGNENCSQGALDSPQNQVDQTDVIKSNFDTKPLEELIVNTSDAQNLGVNCSPQLTMENSNSLGKKLCPLEMSIKAANIDIEFEKCEAEIPVLVENNLAVNEVKLADNLLNSDVNSLKIDLNEPVLLDQSQMPSEDCNLKKLKTEIMWDNNSVKDGLNNSNFQESLICEVEEVNDEEGEDESYEETFISKGDIQNNKDGQDSSSEESDGLPLSVALKLKELPNRNCADNKRSKKNKSEFMFKSVKSKGKKSRRVQEADVETDCKGNEDDENWSESDEDVLNLKRIKNEKQSNSHALKDDKTKAFVRVRSCCSKKECSKKISLKDQLAAYKHFYELESNFKRDSYLINCIEHVQKNKAQTTDKNLKEKNDNYLKKLEDTDSLLVNPNIQMEIENESNGNQKLSDEIQNAINESLKDCGVQLNGNNKEIQSSDREEKNNWNYYIVIDRCKKKVCLQFLLKLFRLTKNRIKQLQKKILSGTSLIEEINVDDVWEAAKLHLYSLIAEIPPNCVANPQHRFFSKNYTREELFVNFKEFYYDKNGKDVTLKLQAYKRFLDTDKSLSFLQRTDGICSACEDLKKRKKSNKNSKETVRLQKTRFGEEGKMKKKKNTDLVDGTLDNEATTCKRIKLTIPLKSINSSNITPQHQKKQNSKIKNNDKRAKSTKDKSRHSTTRGRDVWSLMLLHLETMPYKECKSCTNKKKHRFLSSTFTTLGLFEDYRKYFLRETNSELGLGFTMYEKYFNKNCNYTIMDLSAEVNHCPRCISDQARS